MELEDFLLDKELSDERYQCYHAAIPVNIFRDVLTDEDLEINIHVSCTLSDLLACVNDYLAWLQSCEEEVCGYYKKLINEPLPKDWFESLSVYRASLTFDSSEDFGATISFGDSILSDHILQFDFEKQKVTGDRLDG